MTPAARPLTALTIAAVLAVGWPWGTAAPSPGVRVPMVARVAVPESPARVTTYNTLKSRTGAAVHRDLLRLAGRSDVIVLQETARRSWVTAVPGFVAVRASGAGAGRPILFRAARYELAARGTVLAQWFPIHRRSTWVRLFDRMTGRPLTVVDYHGLPHVELAGHPRALPRVAAYARSLARLAALLGVLPGPLIVGGDWNVNRWSDRRVRWHGFPAAWQARHPRLRDADRFHSRGTLGRRTVDYLFSRELSPVALRVGRGFGSDHRPVTVTFTGP